MNWSCSRLIKDVWRWVKAWQGSYCCVLLSLERIQRRGGQDYHLYHFTVFQIQMRRKGKEWIKRMFRDPWSKFKASKSTKVYFLHFTTLGFHLGELQLELQQESCRPSHVGLNCVSMDSTSVATFNRDSKIAGSSQQWCYLTSKTYLNSLMKALMLILYADKCWGLEIELNDINKVI